MSENTVGRTIQFTGGGAVPPWAVVTDSVSLAWIPGTQRSSVVIAEDDDEDFGLTVWAYVCRAGSVAELIYAGGDRTEAHKVASGFTKAHFAKVDRLSHSEAGVRVATPTTR